MRRACRDATAPVAGRQRCRRRPQRAARSPNAPARTPRCRLRAVPETPGTQWSRRRTPQSRSRRRGARPSCPGKRSVPDAMWSPVLAVLLAHELFIRVVVAFEPTHAAVALEDEEVCRDSVEEPAVVTDHDDATREAEDRLLERA